MSLILVPMPVYSIVIEEDVVTITTKVATTANSTVGGIEELGLMGRIMVDSLPVSLVPSTVAIILMSIKISPKRHVTF